MIQHVKADSLASVFTDNTLSAFTPSAISKGVTQDSIIYITCNASDAATFGSQYVEGSNWIWAKGKIFGGGSIDPEISIEEVLEVLENNLIHFSIAGITYEAEDGMNWVEWANSEYNVDEFYTDDFVYSINDEEVIAVESNDVFPQNLIIANYVYTLE